MIHLAEHLAKPVRDWRFDHSKTRIANQDIH